MESTTANVQVSLLKERFNTFLDVLDSIEPENTDLEDIDRLIAMIDEIETKCKEIQSHES